MMGFPARHEPPQGLPPRFDKPSGSCKPTLRYVKDICKSPQRYLNFKQNLPPHVKQGTSRCKSVEAECHQPFKSAWQEPQKGAEIASAVFLVFSFQEPGRQ